MRVRIVLQRAAGQAGALVIALSLFQAKIACAQDSSAAAEALFNDARAAMSRHEFNIACEKFRESDRLDPAVGTRFNLANCEEQRGQLTTAWALYQQVAETLPVGDARLPIAKERVGAIDARLPRLTIRARGDLPTGTTVKVAGLTLQVPSLGSPVPLNPGGYQIFVSSPGKPARQFSVSLAEGEAAEFVIPADAHPPEATKPSPDSPKVLRPSSDEVDGDGGDREALAYVSGGLGIAGLAVGLVTGLAGLHQESIGNSNCSDATRTCAQAGFDANRSARAYATVSTVGFVTGVLGIGASAYLWLTLPDGKVGVAAANGGASLEWGSRW